jgi:hypothetical protein
MAITLGGLHTWAAITSYSMNADGISYLDIGDAYIRGDWDAAINSVWSPLYSWILGPIMHLLRPSMRWEFPVVHLVDFAIYLGALGCFGFFWHQLMRYWQNHASSAKGAWITLPQWTQLALGYILFIYASLNLIELWAVTPDMLMAAFVYLAAGLILRIRIKVATWRTFVLLGAVLGLGYLAKSVMLPLTYVFLFVALFSARDVRKAVPRVALALLVFLLFCAPFVTLLSSRKGRLTFGDAGKLTYARNMNGVAYPHWQGGPPGNGTPTHPSRKIFDAPPVYEFATPIGGTFPIAYDQTYWYEGLVVQYDLRQLLNHLPKSGLFYYDLFFCQQAALVIGVALLYLMGRCSPTGIGDLISRWGLILPALAAFGFYSLVTVIGRYVGVFVVLLWADLLANIHLPDSAILKRLIVLTSVIMMLFMLTNIVAFNLEGFVSFTVNTNTGQTSNVHDETPSWPGAVAIALYELGVQPEDKVAIIGYGFDSFWARLARVQIVAQMLPKESSAFWLGDPALQSQVLQAFAGTGAKVVVAENVPGHVSLINWHRVGNSNYYIYILAQ